MYQLRLHAILTELAEPPADPGQVRPATSANIVISGSKLDDVRMIMSDRGPANAFFNCVERLLAEAEIIPREESTPNAANPPTAKEPDNGVGNMQKGKKKAKDRGAERAEVGAVPAVDGTPEVTPASL